MERFEGSLFGSAAPRERVPSLGSKWDVVAFGIENFLAPQAPRFNTLSVMTPHKLLAMIRAGYGQGHFHRYKPWTPVTKQVSTPVSNVGHAPDPTTAGLHHLLSRSQRGSLFGLKWLGAVDVRLSYPVWPWSHPHPAIGLQGCDDLPSQPGLTAAAKSLGVRLPCYSQLKIPCVQTVDVMTTWPCHVGYQLVAVDLGAKSAWPDPTLPRNIKRRVLRRYFQEARIRFIHMPPGTVPEGLAINLAAIEPKLNGAERERLAKSSVYADTVAVLREDGFRYPVSTLLAEVRRRHDVPAERLQQAYELCLWNQETDHNLAVPLQPWLPLVHGGYSLRARLRDLVFEEGEA
ncbi:hypothetical protein [Piscinibacter sp. HJYY11]|uniref:hypothetical protein n=1 Tax=Piscinibacter sp. HJYY11 TaxID=2801333 RepID=UPI00191CA442|nr:hypothetical protein [Piscinibacter sp. HJYY11]MBL0729574.1 hypothetical protein [Piscinibacter sp. HJYY11]